jgi:SAM-dependent methyltransferase
MIRQKRGPNITRYYMYDYLSKSIKMDNYNGKTLSISHSSRLCQCLGISKLNIIEANYPDYNILSLPFSDNQFDYVVSDQVLEHVEGDPQTVFDETFRILKPGGIAIHTTCFINPIHEYPDDFWRFTPQGLKYLGRKFSSIEVGSWGNPYVWLIVWLGLRFDGIPVSRWHPLHHLAILNCENWAIVTWVVVRK